MSQPEPRGEAALRKLALPGQPRDAEGPVFSEPWQAQAFALAVRLHEAGCFSWSEWAEALNAVLRETGALGADEGSRYYEHWLAALERLVAAKGLLTPTALHARKAAWAQAYRDTPHGKPVHLRGKR